MEEFGSFFKNEDAVRYFSEAVSSGTLSHTYILEGGTGSGRHTLTRLVACAMAMDGSCKDRILCGNSPDIIETGLSEKKKTIGVEAIRLLKTAAYIRPSELDFKIFIISDADTLTVAAQNAALKLLEEPPAGVCFFLFCENSSALLPTVRSRAQTIRMQRFTSDELTEYLIKTPKYKKLHDSDPERFENALRMSDGCIGRAKELLESSKSSGGTSDSVNEIITMLRDRSFSGLLICAQGFPAARADIDAVLSSLQEALRDMVYVRSGDDDSMLIFFGNCAQASEAGRTLTERSIIQCGLEAAKLRVSLSQNINIQNAKISIADRLWSAISV